MLLGLVDQGTKIMNPKRRQYVLNLLEWELPRLDDLEYTLVEDLAAKARWKGLGSEALGGTPQT